VDHTSPRCRLWTHYDAITFRTAEPTEHDRETSPRATARSPLGPRYETQWATARAAHIAAKRQNAGVGIDGDDGAREVASLTLDLTSGTPGDSPEPNWEPDDAPDDLVPNRTDLEGGPRHGLTEWLKGARVHRPDPREAARRIDRNRYGD
jgi:hypothetical protein